MGKLFEFSSIRTWITSYNDVMNHVDCVIKHDVYLLKMYSCSKNIWAYLRISVVYQEKYIIGVIAWVCC